MAISTPQNTPKVEASFKDELAKTLKDGFTAEEVRRRQEGVAAGADGGRGRRTALWSDCSRRAQRFDRTLKCDEAMEAKVAALTPEQISAAFRKFSIPRNSAYVKAGDFKKAGVLQ